MRVRSLREGDAEGISAVFTELGWDKPASQYLRYFSEQEHGERDVLVAFAEEKFAGYVTVVWNTEYPPFRAEGVPEVKDLNMLPKFRRKGIASRLMDAAEKSAAKYSWVVGVEVGMTADYGATQRMYVKRGYVPDGRGLMWSGRPVKYGERVPADDGLVLFFTKSLGA